MHRIAVAANTFVDQIGQTLYHLPMRDVTKRTVRETVALYDAKTNLSELVARAAAGEEFVIAKSGRPMALLSPLRDVKPLRLPGQGKGKWHTKRSFDAPLPTDVFDAFTE
jgi:prevent-host-death family protein